MTNAQTLLGRWGVLLLSISLVALAWAYQTFFCYAEGSNYCPFDEYRLIIIKPLFLFSLALLIASPGVFFVSDRAFRSWLRFALIWFALAALWVALARTTYHTFNPYSNPTKEDAARIMSLLFVPVSYTWLFIAQRRSVPGRK